MLYKDTSYIFKKLILVMVTVRTLYKCVILSNLLGVPTGLTLYGDIDRNEASSS